MCPPRGTQEAPKRPLRGHRRPLNGPREASKLLPRGRREASHEIPANIKCHAPSACHKGCLACRTLHGLVLLLFRKFPKNSPWGFGPTRRPPGKPPKKCTPS
eukprot:7228503-Pyramimonas_sp.AAC.1